MIEQTLSKHELLAKMLGVHKNVTVTEPKGNKSTDKPANIDKCTSGPCPGCTVFIACWQCDVICGVCGYQLVPQA